MQNYWDILLDDETLTKEDLFLRVRDLYIQFLRHLYNDPKDIPDVRICFSEDRNTVPDVKKNGYPVYTVVRGTNKIERTAVRDVMEVENFENSYTWFIDQVFVIFDFRENGISPLQFITGAFWTELIRQIETSGLRRVKIQHQFEMLIASGVAEFFYGFYRLDISFIQTLSAMTYEGSYVNCSILVPRYDSRPEEKRTARKGMDIVFRDPPVFTADNLRQIRKLMELSDKNVSLVISDLNKIRGLTREGARPNECLVRMWDHLSWTITYEGGRKISYYNARYHIHSSDTSGRQFSKNSLNMTKELNQEEFEHLEAVVREAARQRHGTILIIGSEKDTEDESDRLGTAKSATEIGRINLYEKIDLISCLTSIDGAVLLDVHCDCSCIGVILDGDAVVRGNVSRGARYNSTVNYVTRRAQLGQEFLGVVISEDGTVDLVTSERVVRLILK